MCFLQNFQKLDRFRFRVRVLDYCEVRLCLCV